MGGNSLKNTSEDFGESTLLQLNNLESSKTSSKTNIVT
jgi:nucleoside phosphorylase